MQIIKFLFCFLFITSNIQAQIFKRALFLGNSYTAYNSLPSLVSKVAGSQSDSLQVVSYNPGGYRFLQHDTTITVNNYINNQTWDFVILQEQSQLPSFSPAQVAQEVYPYAASLCQKIAQKDSCTNVVFYMTWGRKNGDSQNCGFYPPVCTYEGMQQRLRESYLEMAETNNAWAAPVGAAWKVVRDSFPAVELYTSDQSHPSIFGSYLAACTIYSTLFHKSPVGAYFPTSIHPDTALILQQTAALVVLDSLPNWNIDLSNQAVFQYNLLPNGQLQITDIQTVDSHLWIFGDGNTSTDSIPSFQYQNQGTYNLTHIVEKKCKSDTFTTVVNYLTTGLDMNQTSKFSVFPNPVQDKIFFLENLTCTEISLIDYTGKKFVLPVNQKENSVNCQNIPDGIYIIQISDQTFEKILIKH